jgi:hypothetical protein
MNTNVIFIGWNRAVAGREAQAGELFQEFLGYLAGLQQSGTIQSFEPVLLSPHGGDLNGFFLIRGESSALDALVYREEWQDYVTLSGMVLEGSGVVRGAAGEMVAEWMDRWSRLVPA